MLCIENANVNCLERIVCMGIDISTNIFTFTVFAITFCSFFSSENSIIKTVLVLGCTVEWRGLWDNVRRTVILSFQGLGRGGGGGGGFKGGLNEPPFQAQKIENV